MIFKDLQGQSRSLPLVRKYRIDWTRSVSKPQMAVKQFLQPYWSHDIVFEELPLVGTGRGARRWRADLVNINKGVMVEVSPDSSHSYNKFFHHGSPNRFKDALKRDILKRDWARINNLKFVEILDDDFPLSVQVFERQGVIL